MPARRLTATLLMVGIGACGERASAPQFCGQTFCIKGIASHAVQEKAGLPADFKLYQVQTTAGPILIYEGNHPEIASDSLSEFEALPDGRLRSFQRIEGRALAVFVNTDSRHPRYTVVAQACDRGACDIERLAARIKAR